MSKKLKVLHLSAAKNWGGGENHIENLFVELQEMDEKVENIILCIRNGVFHQKIKDKGLIVETAPMLIKLDLRYTAKILCACKKYKIDLIHIHDSTALALAVMATKLGKLPPFILSKKTSFPIKDRPRTLYKYNHPHIQKILCVSEKTKEVTSNSVNDNSKLVTVYHGTRINKTEKPLFNLREKLNLPEDKIIVGTIANHIRAKNLKTWVKMINFTVNIKKEKKIHFVQIGSYSGRSQTYIDRINELNLENHVSFLGFIPDASALIPQFDISLLTSQSEGLPQFIYESFYYKVPVISTNVGGIPEIIEDGVNGMLSNPYQAQCLADKLIALSQDKNLMEKFIELSYQKLIENFTTRKMAEQTLAEYKKVLYEKN